jgi:hypothetical protein
VRRGKLPGKIPDEKSAVFSRPYPRSLKKMADPKGPVYTKVSWLAGWGGTKQDFARLRPFPSAFPETWAYARFGRWLFEQGL